MIRIEDVETYNMIAMILSFAIGIATKHYADIYISAKHKLSEIRKVSNFVDEKISQIDDALQDNKIDNAEFARIFSTSTEEIQAAKEKIQI